MAIRAACADAGIDPDRRPIAATAVYCVAGADIPVDDRRIAAELGGRGWARKTIVRNDTFAMLRAGTERGWGVAVVCGSGLNCAGVGPDGRVVRFPSFGELSGDRAHGGGWLGRAALGGGDPRPGPARAAHLARAAGAGALRNAQPDGGHGGRLRRPPRRQPAQRAGTCRVHRGRPWRPRWREA